MRRHRLSAFWLIALLGLPASSLAESYKIEALKEAPPAAIADEVRTALATDGYRVVDDKGKPYAEIWLRKSTPATSKPAGIQGQIQFPFLSEGTVVGALRFPGEGHDYRDQTIAKGVYTLRYGLQPVNGAHLGVSPYRDYLLLLPAARDKSLAEIKAKPLEEKSAESAGTSHPAVLLLMTAPDGAGEAPAVHHDQEKNTWGAVIPLKVGVKGSDSPTTIPIQLVIVGAAAV